MLTTVCAIAAIVLYLGAATLLMAPITGCPRTLRRMGLAAALAAVVLHAAVLLGAHDGRLDLHFYAVLSLVAAVAATLTLLVNLWRQIAGLGVIVFPLAALAIALDLVLAPETSPAPINWQISLHVAIALISYSLLSIAAALAILLALQERAMRVHRPLRLVRSLPPITQTESVLFKLIALGFGGLTLTLLSGALFVEDILGQHLAHIIAFSVIAWLVFGILLLGRRRWGWRGARAVNLTLTGMALLAIGFFGSKFVLELMLNRGP